MVSTKVFLQRVPQNEGWLKVNYILSITSSYCSVFKLNPMSSERFKSYSYLENTKLISLINRRQFWSASSITEERLNIDKCSSLSITSWNVTYF